LTHIPLTQQRIATLGEELEKAMKIEAMEGYLGNFKIMRPPKDANIVQLKGQISTLIKKIQELSISKVG
jgi:hypothetical protein